MSGENPRQIALRALRRGASGEFLEDRLEAELSRIHLSPPDRRLCQELAYGVVRWQATLDWLIARKSDAREQKPALQNILRLGLYQIFWLDRIPPHAAVNETVELARQSHFHAQAGFLNAVLRNYLREAEETKRLLAELRMQQPHLGYSHPEWLVKRWQQRWGAENAASLMQWNNTPPGTYARVNTLKTDAAKLLTQWRDEGVEYDFFRKNWTGENTIFLLKNHPPLARMHSFQQGWFYIQDPSTLLAVQQLSPQPGESVLDLCAAPGGKLTYIAQLMRNEGILVAHDTSPERVKLIEQNCARLGVTCVRSISALAHQPSSHFDRILIDAPCSNTGVMRRRVDLRWRITPEEVTRLRATQRELLVQAAARLCPGGTLVYSTCSLEPEENGELVQEFVAANPSFTLELTRELTPFADAVDGTYVARMVKNP